MKSSWKIRVDATTEAKAQVLLNRITDVLSSAPQQCRFEKHHDGGFAIYFELHTASAIWNEAIIETIAEGQRFGRQWVLAGNIIDDPNASTVVSTVPGVQSIQWHMINK